MNRNLILITALSVGIPTFAFAGSAHSAVAQAPEAPAQAAAPAPAPKAVAAMIAVVQFEQAAAATNEGQRALQELQKKYEPKKTQLDTLGAEIDTLTKQLQAAPASMADDERASRQRTIETKQKQYQRDGEDAQSAYAADLQEAIGKVAQKMGPVIVKYVQTNGYNMLFDAGAQQGGGGLTLMWGGTDISQAVVDAYNTSSGVAAPVPSAPSASRPRPATTAPRTTPAPKPAAPK